MEWKNKIDECCANELEEMIIDEIKAGFSSDDDISEECEEYIEENYPEDSENITSEELAEIIEEYRSEYENTGDQENFLKLDSVFRKLDEQGIVSLHCSGYVQQDGFDDCNEIASERHENGEKVIGCCFYTMQDLEPVLHEESSRLYLSFGNYFKNPTAVEVGEMIVKELEAAGFSVEWKKSADVKIALEGIVWDKQYSDEDE